MNYILDERTAHKNYLITDYLEKILHLPWYSPTSFGSGLSRRLRVCFIRELRNKLTQERYEWLRNLGYSMSDAGRVNEILQFADSFTSIEMLKNFNHPR